MGRRWRALWGGGARNKTKKTNKKEEKKTKFGGAVETEKTKRRSRGRTNDAPKKRKCPAGGGSGVMQVVK